MFILNKLNSSSQMASSRTQQMVSGTLQVDTRRVRHDLHYTV